MPHPPNASPDPPPDGLHDIVERWRAIGHAFPDVLLLVSPDGTIQYYNRSPAWLQDTSVLGQSVLDFVPPRWRDRVRQGLAGLTPGATPRRRRIRALLPDGSRRWFTTHTAPLHRDGRVVAATIVVRDVTSLQRLRARLRRSEERRRAIAEELRQVHQIELVGVLTTGVAHDFNNILTMIANSAELLLLALPDGDPLRPDVEDIRRATQRGSALTNHILTLASQQPFAPERLELNAIIDEFIPLLRSLLGRNVRLLVQLDTHGAPVRANRTQIEQVLLNLLVNARDAMPAGGTVIISTTRLAHPRAQSSKPCQLRGPVVRLRVEDTGTGIHDSDLERMFDLFFTTKAPGQASGLGLAAVHAIVKRYAGCLDVASRVGLGTIVDVVLQDADRATSTKSPSRSAA